MIKEKTIGIVQHLVISILLALICSNTVHAQNNDKKYLVPVTEHNGEKMLHVTLPTVYIFKPLNFKSQREWKKYYRLVHNIKKVYPIAKEINRAIIETYEFMQTLPTKKAKENHLKKVEKGLKRQYKAKMKRLTFSQGKLLIKLVDRESNQTSYELVKAFMGPFKAGFYQAFASLFGASLKKEYDPTGKDQLIERIIILIENHQL